MALIAAPGPAADLPPESMASLAARAKLIVTGTVVEKPTLMVARSHTTATDYSYSLTVKVDKVVKGQFDPSRLLIAKGEYRAFAPGVEGSSAGHFADNTRDRLYSVTPGWVVTLYLTNDDWTPYRIAEPNGFTVVSKPAGELPIEPPVYLGDIAPNGSRRDPVVWPYYVLGVAAVRLAVAPFLIRRRRRRGAAPPSTSQRG